MDGDGLALAPGFVDLHSHSDLYTMVPGDTGATVGDEPKLLQGCTAQVFGQDGISAAPVHRHDVDEFTRFLAGLDGEIDRDRWTWSSFAEYLTAVRRGSTTRAAGLVGHATVRRYVMGMANRPPTDDELVEMQGVVADALDQGAAGFSTGLVYVPAAFATTAEVTALCEVAASRGKPFFVHVRSESEHVVEATDEVIEVAARSGVHLHYSHIKTAGERNWDKAPKMLAQLEAASSSGVRITADIHPYVSRVVDGDGAAPAVAAGRHHDRDRGEARRPRREGTRPGADARRRRYLGQLVRLLRWMGGSAGSRHPSFSAGRLHLRRPDPAHRGRRPRLARRLRRGVRPPRLRGIRGDAHLVQQRRGQHRPLLRPAVHLGRLRRGGQPRWASPSPAVRDLPTGARPPRARAGRGVVTRGGAEDDLAGRRHRRAGRPPRPGGGGSARRPGALRPGDDHRPGDLRGASPARRRRCRGVDRRAPGRHRRSRLMPEIPPAEADR